MRQRFGACFIQLSEPGGPSVDMRIGQGWPPGDTEAGTVFMESFHPILDEFLTSTSHLNIPSVCEWGDVEVDIGINTFLDDIIRTVIVKSPHQASQYHRHEREMDISLDHYLLSHGYAQGLPKKAVAFAL